MDVVRKISAVGHIYLSDDQLRWLDVKKGDFIISKDDGGKYGRFISIFKPESPEHLKMVEDEAEKGHFEKNNKNEKQ